MMKCDTGIFSAWTSERTIHFKWKKFHTIRGLNEGALALEYIISDVKGCLNSKQ